MKYIRQSAIILAATCAGELLRYLIPLPVPGSIYGLLLLLGLLSLQIIRLEQVRETGEFLIEIMPLMFILAGAGLITSWTQMKGILLPLCIIIPLSTCLVMLVTGKVTGYLLEKNRKEGKEHE